MTLSTLTSRISYPGAGSIGPFAFPFKIFDQAHLLVTKRSASGVEAGLSLTTHYTVSGVGQASGSITLVTALAVGETLVIRRKPALTQPTSIRNQGVYYPATIEDELDRLIMQLQSIQDQVDRSFKFKETYDPATYNPNVTPGTPGQVLAPDATGLGLQWLSIAGVSSLAVLGAYKASDAPGVDVTGVVDCSAALNTLGNVTIPAAGGTIIWTPGSYLIGSNVIFPGNVQHVFLKGAKLLIANGVTVFFQGIFTAGLYQIFVCTGTGNIDVGPGRQYGLYPEWWGARGDGVTIDTAPIGKAVGAQTTTVSTSTPAGGLLTGSVTPIILTAPEYVIDAAINNNAYAVWRSPNRSRLRQATAGQIILDLGAGYKCEVEGIVFVGGFHAIRYWNNNLDTAKLTVRNCELQLATDFAIRVGGCGTAAGAPAVVSTAPSLTPDASGFNRTDGGSFIVDGFVNGMVCTPKGLLNNMISTITNVTAGKVTVSNPRTAEALTNAAGIEGTFANDTQSSNVLIENCLFYGNAKILSTRADGTTMRSCRGQILNTCPANIPQIVNYAFHLELDNFFGVPPAAGTPANLRWIDNYLRVFIQRSRFGAENGGIPTVWHRGPAAAPGTDANGTAVEIVGGYVIGGAANPTSGVICCCEGIPEEVSVRGVRGLAAGVPVVTEMPASTSYANIVLATVLATYGTSIDAHFRWDIRGNLANSPGGIPPAVRRLLLRRYDQMLTEPLVGGAGGAVALNQATAVDLLTITFDAGAGNDDALAIDVDYMVEDASGANRNIEKGRVGLAAVRNSGAVTVANLQKYGNAQALSTAVTNGVVFTAVVVGNVVTLKCTATTSNGDSSNIVFSARVIKQPTRANTTIVLAVGPPAVAWDQAGT